MGEYAIRKSDNKSIKIGTCDDMYYLRYEDKDKVTCEEGSCFGRRWRLPLPWEDDVKPGEYEDPYFRGEGRVPLDWATVVGDNGEDETIFYKPKPSFIERPGFVQIKHSGILLGLNCYHGERLPEVTGDIRSAHWNGRSTYWNLVCLRETDGGLFPVVQCAICGDYFRETWAGVLPFIRDEELHRRLQSCAIFTVVR